MPWVFLIIAGALEIIWATAMKQSQGFTRALPTTIMLITLTASFVLLALAMRSLPLGTAYAVWTGIGAVGAFIVGVWFLGEPLTLGRSIAALLIVAGIVGMKLTH